MNHLNLAQLSYPLTEWNFWLGIGCFAYNTFHIWCMLGGHVEVCIKNILYWFIVGQTHFGMPRDEFDPR